MSDLLSESETLIVNDKTLEVLNRFSQCNDCSIARELRFRRDVRPRGRLDSPIVIVGEAPGQTEEDLGLAFVGPAGQKLSEVLSSVGIDPEGDVYVTNTIKCRPSGNRAPSNEECRICREKYLVQEIKAYSRKVILALGNYGYYGVVPKGSPSGITNRCGIFEENLEFECLVLPCIHPAAVLRNPSSEALLVDAVGKLAKFVGNGYKLVERKGTVIREIRDLETLLVFADEVRREGLVAVDIECLSEDTLLLDEATGRVRTIREVVERRLPWRVASYLDGKMVLSDVSGWVEKGERECFRIVPEYGWPVEASTNHLMLTLDGWKKVSELTTSDFLARPRVLPFHSSPNVLCDEDVIFLGYWVAEGCVADSPTLSLCDAELEADLAERVAKFGYELHKFNVHGGSSEVNVKRVVVERGRGHENRFRELLLETQLQGVRSTKRFIPEVVFSLPKEKLALFLSRLYAGDGCVDAGGKSLVYDTSSKVLALQLCHLLLRFGLIPRIASVKYDTSDVPGYMVFLEGKEALELFSREIGIFGVKGQRLIEMLPEASAAASLRNSVPKRACVGAMNQLLENHTVEDVFGGSWSNWYSDRVLRSVLVRGGQLGSSELEKIAADEVCWARVRKIEPIGVKKVYDLSVPVAHNFVGSMCIVHNTTGFAWHSDLILCFSFSTEEGCAWYLPLFEDGMWLWPKDTWRDIEGILGGIFEDPKVGKIGFNLKFDLEFLVHYFGWDIRGSLDDPMLMHHLLDENTPHGLKSLATRFTDMGDYSRELETAFVEVKRSRIPLEEKHYGAISSDILSKYAAKDADATFRVYNCFRPLLKEAGLYQFYRKGLIPVMRTLMKMELVGVRVDKDRMSDLEVEFEQKLNELQERTSEFAGWDVNVKSPQQLQKLLFEQLRLPALKRTPKGLPSTDEEALEDLQKRVDCEVLGLILDFRKTFKLYGTYIVGLMKEIAPDGRLHTSYLQMGTTTGRLSSSRPALQQVPRDSTIKSLFVPTEGWLMLSADYSQHELRMWANYSQDEGLIEALATSDVHSTIGSMLLNKPAGEITKEQRVYVKGVVFGLMYGRGAYSVAEEFGISVEEAERIMTLFFSMFPQAAQWLLDQERQAHERGFVQNLFGRVRRLPEINSNDPALVAAAERQARNAPIQSAASDITNLALVRIDKAFSDVGMKARLLLQVHDEVLGEAPREEVLAAKEIVKQEMEAPVPGINVPLKAEVEVVERWGGEPIDVDKI